jgi:hypothetical protein
MKEAPGTMPGVYGDSFWRKTVLFIDFLLSQILISVLVFANSAVVNDSTHLCAGWWLR